MITRVLIPVLATLFIALSCIQIFSSSLVLQKILWTPNSLQVSEDNGVISIGNVYSNYSMARIAPYQDFVYFSSPGYKTSLKSAFIILSQRSVLQKIVTYVFPKSNWSWKLTNPNLDYSYSLNYHAGGFELTRTITGSSEKVDSLGQSLYLCPTCAIAKQTTTKLLVQDNSNGQKFSLALSPGSTINSYPATRILEIVTPVNSATGKYVTTEQISFE